MLTLSYALFGMAVLALVFGPPAIGEIVFVLLMVGALIAATRHALTLDRGGPCR